MNVFTIKEIQTCTSTNDEAKHQPFYSVILAEEQTNGRGRNGRTWVSGKGNLMASIVLPKPESAYIYSFLISLAIAQSIAFLSPRIKWPNDILVNGKKIAGILLEVYDDKLIIGFGVNIQEHPVDTLLYEATDLKEHGRAVEKEKLLHDILQNFQFMLELYQKKGFQQIRLEWLQFAMGVGKRISVKLLNSSIEGVFDGINEDGILILTDDNGKKQQITAGDVFMI